MSNDHLHPIFQECFNSFLWFMAEIGTECSECGVAIPKPANSTEEGRDLCVRCCEIDEETGEPLRGGRNKAGQRMYIGDPAEDYAREDFSEPKERGSLYPCAEAYHD